MFLKLGTVGRALGLQGSFYVSGRDEAFPANIKTILIGRSAEDAKLAQVISVSWQRDRPLIKCSLAGDRTAAEALRGLSIWVKSSEIEIDDSKEFLLKDLVGRSVYDCENIEMGSVADVVIMPASINLIVLNQAKSADVEIPVIPAYVDMNFERNDNRLKLVVPASTFEEIWNARKKK
jgi:16S rRNA processing protein RimM